MELQDIKENLGDIKKVILSHDDIALFTHSDPDGDAIGSIFALNLALKRMGKSSKIVLSGSVSKAYYFLPIPVYEESLNFKPNLSIVLDCATLERSGFHKEIISLDFTKIVNIDHHPQEEIFGHLSIVETDATSTSEIIFHLLEEMGVEIDREIANYLLVGIFSDTGSFMHSNTTKNSLEIASKLVSRGANIKKMAENIFRRKNISTLRLWGRVLSRIKSDSGKGIVSSIITKEDLEECGATKEDLEGVVNLINTVPEAKAALLLTQDQDQIKGSLRSEAGGFDVNKIAGVFGGGGHIRASGFKVKGKLKETSAGWEIIEE